MIQKRHKLALRIYGDGPHETLGQYTFWADEDGYNEVKAALDAHGPHWERAWDRMLQAMRDMAEEHRGGRA